MVTVYKNPSTNKFEEISTENTPYTKNFCKILERMRKSHWKSLPGPFTVKTVCHPPLLNEAENFIL